jgi:hypothetical protein
MFLARGNVLGQPDKPLWIDKHMTGASLVLILVQLPVNHKTSIENVFRRSFLAQWR